MQEKQILRQQLLRQRRSLPLEVWQAQSQQICHHLANWQIFQTAKVILTFISFRQEPDLSYLWLQFPHKKWGFPRCVEHQLIWHHLNPLRLSEFTTVGKFGILEPLPSLPPIDLSQVDLILIPAIACNHTGYRLGYGGGFYDRFLANQSGFKLGIIFADYLVEKLPLEAWDLPLQAICTEKGIFSSNFKFKK